MLDVVTHCHLRSLKHLVITAAGEEGDADNTPAPQNHANVMTAKV